MQFYDCVVTLRGAENLAAGEVYKADISAAEVIMLRAIHGAESVTRIKPTEQRDTDDNAERNRLWLVYAKGGSNPESKAVVAFRELFGNQYSALPTKVPGLAHEEPAPKRTRVAREPATGDAPELLG